MAGPFRSGKSYMLSCLLRYLQNAGHQTTDWLGNIIASPGGFPWRPGIDPETVGVWMWSEPIIVTKGEQEVAIILIDTPGNFDTIAGKENSSKAFIISLLMSSVMIYNKKTSIDEKDFEYLEDLKFLIRDWMDTKKYAYGLEGGNEYVEHDVLSDNRPGSEAIKRIRHKLRSSFRSTTGYLLPHPGLVIEDDSNDGSLDCCKRWVCSLGRVLSINRGNTKKNFGRIRRFSAVQGSG